MAQRIARALFISIIAFGGTAGAQTPLNPPAPLPATPDRDQESNKDSRLRGLDRADQAAGEHGRQGRDTAREAQLNRQNRPERFGQPDRPVRPDRPRR